VAEAEVAGEVEEEAEMGGSEGEELGSLGVGRDNEPGGGGGLPGDEGVQTG
jgi:hypothetical protein